MAVPNEVVKGRMLWRGRLTKNGYPIPKRAWAKGTFGSQACHAEDYLRVLLLMPRKSWIIQYQFFRWFWYIVSCRIPILNNLKDQVNAKIEAIYHIPP